MGKIKDFIYNTSDVLTALIIVGVAAIVIAFNMNNIMAYPEEMATIARQEALNNNENFGLAVPMGDGSQATSEDDAEENSAAGSDGGSSDETDVALAGEEDDVLVHSVYIGYGESTYTIGEKFVSVGLFDSLDHFNEVLEASGNATSIKTGNFIMASTATPEEVITLITTTNGL